LTHVKTISLATMLIAFSAIAVATWRHLTQPMISERADRVRNLTAPKGGVLLIGDSITQAADVQTLCGLPVANAGIAGTGVDDWGELAPVLVERLKPRLVVYALGVNDARRARPFDAKRWAESYRQLRSGNAIIVGPWPVNHPRFSSERVEQMNEELSRLEGYLPPPGDDLTDDGLHLNATGRRKWAERLEGACQRLWPPRPAP